MPHRHGLRTALLVSCSGLLFTACGESGMKVPDPEVHKSDVKLNIPAVPAFDLANKPIKELRVKGKKKLKQDVTVKGFVTWVYDCPTAVRQPNESDKDLQDRIDKDPTLCERAKFYIGDDKDTPAEKSLWIVDVPRPYNKLELERIKKKERTLENYPLLCEPDELKKDPKKSLCPQIAIGDEVEITGRFDVSSDHGERNSDGLIVVKRIKNTTQGYESPSEIGAKKPAEAAAPAGAKPSPNDIVKKP